jgi:hypothetical protein
MIPHHGSHLWAPGVVFRRRGSLSRCYRVLQRCLFMFSAFFRVVMPRDPVTSISIQVILR